MAKQPFSLVRLIGQMLMFVGIFSLFIDGRIIHPLLGYSAVAILLIIIGGFLSIAGASRFFGSIRDTQPAKSSRRAEPLLSQQARRHTSSVMMKPSHISRKPSKVPAILTSILILVIALSAYDILFNTPAPQTDSIRPANIQQAVPERPATKPDSQADATTSGNTSASLVYLAVRNDDMAMLISALSRASRSDINTVTQGMTPLMLASSKGNLEMVDLLLENAADPNTRGSFQRTALQYAAEKNRLEVARRLLARGADINGVDTSKLSPLVMTVDRNYEEFAEFLIKQGADVNIQHVQGWTALIDASRNNNVRLVKLLLEAGADPTARTRNGATAIDFAQGNERDSIAKLLQKNR